MSPIAPQFSAQAQYNAKEKNAEAASPITVKDLSEQIRIALSDFFIAEIRSVSSNHLEMKFPSGEACYIHIGKNVGFFPPFSRISKHKKRPPRRSPRRSFLSFLQS